MLSLANRKLIDAKYDGLKVFDYGSIFFAITEKNEIIAKSIDLLDVLDETDSEALDLSPESRYEYVEDVCYTNNESSTISAILDKDNIYVFENKVDFLKTTVNDINYTYCTSTNYVDFDKDSEIYEKLLDVVRTMNSDTTISDLSKLNESDKYISFVLVKDTAFCMIQDEDDTRLLKVELSDNDDMEKLAMSVLFAEERISYDTSTLISIDELESKKQIDMIDSMINLNLEDIKPITIANALNINYQSFCKSKDKNIYFTQFKLLLIEKLLEKSKIAQEAVLKK